MPTSQAQKEANKRWREKHRDYWVGYYQIPHHVRDPEYFKQYYQKIKKDYKYIMECRRLRKMLL